MEIQLNKDGSGQKIKENIISFNWSDDPPEFLQPKPSSTASESVSTTSSIEDIDRWLDKALDDYDSILKRLAK